MMYGWYEKFSYSLTENILDKIYSADKFRPDSSFITILIILILTLCAVFYLQFNHQYWKRKNVPYVKPNIIFGNNLDFIQTFNALQLQSYVNFLDKYYRSCEKYIGLFSYFTPYLLIKDLDLVKNILSTDSVHFQNRGLDVYSERDFLSKNLLFLEYHHWKPLRKSLTPLFSNNKMKQLFHSVQECTDKLIATLEQHENEDVELKEYMERHVMDIVCCTIFGIKADCLNKAEQEQFQKAGLALLRSTTNMRLYLILRDLASFIFKIFPLHIIGKEEKRILIETIAKVLSCDKRKNRSPAAKDFFDFLLELKSNHLHSEKFDMSVEFITAQCLSFFLAGYESSSSTISFCLMELAKHPDIQRKVQQEIDELLQSNSDQLTYEVLQKTKYLDMVVSETLRIYPPVFILARTCTKDYSIPGTDVIIEKNTKIIIPIYSIHHDPRYYNDPDTFNPENFSLDAKSFRQPFAYIPFGEGPKICIGKIFALLQVKLTLVSILRQFNVKLSEKMKFPITFLPLTITLQSKNGLWLKLSHRSYTTEK